MTLHGYLTLSYFMVAAVFAVLLETSTAWRAAVAFHVKRHNWATLVTRFAVLVLFGCAWPLVALYWLFT